MKSILVLFAVATAIPELPCYYATGNLNMWQNTGAPYRYVWANQPANGVIIVEKFYAKQPDYRDLVVTMETDRGGNHKFSAIARTVESGCPIPQYPNAPAAPFPEPRRPYFYEWNQIEVGSEVLHPKAVRRQVWRYRQQAPYGDAVYTVWTAQDGTNEIEAIA